MDVQVETRGGVTILSVRGDIDAATAPALESQVVAAAGEGCKLLFDLAGVTFMSSAGLRVLLLLHRRVTATGGQLVIVGLSESIRDIMAATGFLARLRTSDTVDAALQLLT